MTHVHISQENAAGPLKVVIDGMDVSRHIYDEGFGLVRVVGEDPRVAEWGVQMIVAADSLDVDLPHAVLAAVARTDEQMVARAEESA